MKVIIDPYRGGSDTGVVINGKYEKNLLLELSQYLNDRLNSLGVNSEIVRDNDISLSDDERNSIINELKDRNDIIIQNRYIDTGNIEIIYSLRNSDALASLISNDLKHGGYLVEKYYQRRLPSNTMLDYYSVIRNTNPNEAIIIEYGDLLNYKEVINIIALTLANYIKGSNTYVVKSGDNLYKIANKFGVSVDDIKNINKLGSNLLSIGQVLKIPNNINNDYIQYVVVKGDSLYKISKKYNTSVNEIKKLNNLNSDLLSIGQLLKVPNNIDNDNIQYVVVKGDSLYKISKKYNTTVDEIKKLNNLSSNLLSIGQVLKIPK